MPAEDKVRNPDLPVIILLRYFLETASKLSLENVRKAGGNEDFCALMESAATGQITDSQAEYVVNFYAMRMEDLDADLENVFSTVRHMASRALKGQ